MTIGRRCQEYGYGFCLDPFSDQPYYSMPDGKGGWDGDVVPMYAFDYCPYLPDFDNEVYDGTELGESLTAAPAAVGTADQSGAAEEAKAALAEAEEMISKLLGTHGGVRPADHWVAREETDPWLRVHEKRRKALFIPEGVKGAPDVDTLSDTRVLPM